MIRIHSGRQLWAYRDQGAGRSIDWLSEATGIPAERIALFEAGRESLPNRLIVKCVRALAKDMHERLRLIEEIMNEPEISSSPTDCSISPQRLESAGCEVWS